MMDRRPRLNIKTVFSGMVPPLQRKDCRKTVLSLWWEFLYWLEGIITLRRGPGSLLINNLKFIVQLQQNFVFLYIRWQWFLCCIIPYMSRHWYCNSRKSLLSKWNNKLCGDICILGYKAMCEISPENNCIHFSACMTSNSHIYNCWKKSFL